MIENIVFSKLYKNKRYLKKLYEHSESYEEIKQQLLNGELINNEPLQNFLYNVENTLLFNETDEELSLLTGIEYRSADERIDSLNMTLNEFKKFIYDDYSNYINKQPQIRNNQIIFFNLFKSEFENKKAKFCRYRLFKRIIINKKTASSKIDAILCYGIFQYASHANDTEYFNKYINKRLNVRKIGCNGRKYNFYLTPNFFEKIKYLLFLPTETNISQNIQKNTTYKKREVPNLWKYNVETTDDTDSKPSSEVSMHIKSYKNMDGVLPFIYTNEAVTDDKARKYYDVCNMVENNITTLEDKLLDNLSSTIKYNKKNINITNDMKVDIHDEYKNNIETIDNINYIKDFNYSLNGTTSLQDARHMRKIAINVCDVYLRAMADAKKHIFDKDYKNSKGLNYNIHLYLTEILSPLVVVANKCEWNELNENEGFKIFRKYVNLPNNENFINEAYINYPTESNFPLADSAIYINGYRLYVSTKAGLNGLGASASIKSLKQFLYNPNNGEMTGLAKEMEQEFNEQFNLFKIFLDKSIQQFNWKEIEKITHNQVSTRYELKKYLELNKDIFTKIIMNILQAASFQFVQVNCKASSTTEDFHFNYRVQYPAIFKGNVDIELPSEDKNSGAVKFHIVESNK